MHPGEPSIASALDLDGASQATWVSRIHNLTTLSRVPQSFYSMPLKKWNLTNASSKDKGLVRIPLTLGVARPLM